MIEHARELGPGAGIYKVRMRQEKRRGPEDAGARRVRPCPRPHQTFALLSSVVFIATFAQAQESTAPSNSDESAVDLVYSGKDLSLLDLLQLEVVSASDASESVARAPAVIDVITKDDIERYGFRTLGEALEMVAGLDLLHDHYQYNLGVRGVTSAQRGWSRIVKVMIDGQTIALRTSGENFLGIEAVPLLAVERIEIIRGPGSVLYGANAFLGVINIITKEGHQIEGAVVQAGYEGGPNQRSPYQTAVLGLDNGKWSLLASAAQESQSRFGYRMQPLPGVDAAPSDETSEAEGHPAASAFGRVAYQPDEHTSFIFDAHYQRLIRDAEFTDWGPMVHDNQIDLQNGFARLTYDANFENKVFWRLSGALAAGGPGETERLNVGENFTTYIERDAGYVARDVEVSARYQLPGASQLTLGLDSSVQTQELQAHYVVTPQGDRILNPPPNTQTGTREFLRIGAYANSTVYPFELLKYDPLAHLGLVGGVRLDSQNIYGEDFNSRAGVVYDIDTRHYFKLLYGSSYRAPASSQLFSNFIEPRGVIGNPDLRPERARTFEAAVGASPIRGIVARLSAYYTRIEDRVEIQLPSPATSNRRPANSTPIDSFGAEGQLDFKWSDYAGFVNYSYQSSSFEKRNTLSIDAETVDVETPAYADHLLKFGGSVDFPDLFARASFTGRWVGRRLGTLDNNSRVNGRDFLVERYSLDPYLLVDVAVSTLGIRWFGYRETRFMAKVRNLFNTEYVFPFYGQFDVPGFTRTIEISVRQEL